MAGNSNKYILLSHRLNFETLSYDNRDMILIDANSSIFAGETKNSNRWVFTNNHK